MNKPGGPDRQSGLRLQVVTFGDVGQKRRILEMLPFVALWVVIRKMTAS